MRFIINYEGELPSSGSPKEKHEIRRQLHPQLKRQWEVEPALLSIRKRFLDTNPAGDIVRTGVDLVAEQFRRPGFRFVPLVRKELSLVCQLSVIFLRQEEPGELVRKGGDIDNRLKTLLDSLSVPNEDQLKGICPGPGEDPLYCLLEDDSLITGIEVKTERLLVPQQNKCDVRLLMTVIVRPSHVNEQNLRFLGGWL